MRISLKMTSISRLQQEEEEAMSVYEKDIPTNPSTSTTMLLDPECCPKQYAKAL